ncbi:ferritin-like domain-containing protein [Streptomyces sp. NBC_01591]|uniref:DUF455 family protein n=1 Tax=Streptomyces sp. NBC_01591 TaxID=2975888 RepID=UPI002DD8BC11|nr:DUF455 family protein [Streptomyces sp. NBC_01591]WSD71864.1 ferritin-like domain-containing protein [Streptomyces sp. NBC_01591]
MVEDRIESIAKGTWGKDVANGEHTPFGEMDTMAVPELSAVTRSLHQSTLLFGRGLAAFAPLVAELPERHFLIQTVFGLIQQSAALRTRLLEMRVTEESLGGPSDAAVAEAREIVRATPGEALSFASSLLQELVAAYGEMVRSCSSEALYHDRKLYSACRELCQEALDVAERHGLTLPPREIRRDALYVSSESSQQTPTGTVELDALDCPHRSYPKWAKFQFSRDGSAAARTPEDGEVRDSAADQTPAIERLRDGRTAEPISSNVSLRNIANFDALEKSSVVALLQIGFQIEFISTDVPLRNIASFADMPMDFYLDMVRHAHDEMRHTHLLVEEMSRLGVDAQETLMKRPDTYDAIADRPLDYRLIILSRTGEDAAIETFSDVIPKLRRAGFVEAAAMFDHVLADELRHVAYANKWLTYLCDGDDAEVERLTTERIQLFNQVAEDLGLGEKALRAPDHIAARASAADMELRALAGFSRRDLAKMAAKR